MNSSSRRSCFVLAIAWAACCSLCVPLAVNARAAEATGLIAVGSQWETPFYIVDSGTEGPTVVLTGGIHGNEPAGFRAAEQIRRWPIVKGRLVVVPAVNVPGLKANTRRMPNVPRARGDLNRAFVVGNDGGLSTSGILATELWGFVAKQDPDWVIDLHEGSDFHVSHKPPDGRARSVGSSIIYSTGETAEPLVERALVAANAHVTEPDRAFVPLSRGPIGGSLARATAVNLGASSMILETTFNHQPISLRTRQHRAMVNSLLHDIGLIDRDCSELLSPGASAEAIQVGFYDGPGTGPLGKNNIPRIADEAANIELHFLGVADFRPRVLRQFDVLVFPGGSGSKQANALGKNGRKHIRDFVRNGGGCIGVCAGGYLCSAHYSWSLNLIDCSVFTGAREIEGIGRKQMWYRGGGKQVDVELSDSGKQIFSGVPPQFSIHYHNGPIMSPKQHPEIEDYTPLAWYRSEHVRYEPQRGTMVNTPAIVSGHFGEGRVMSISPHPEADKDLESIIVDSVRWVADQSPGATTTRSGDQRSSRTCPGRKPAEAAATTPAM